MSPGFTGMIQNVTATFLSLHAASLSQPRDNADNAFETSFVASVLLWSASSMFLLSVGTLLIRLFLASWIKPFSRQHPRAGEIQVRGLAEPLLSSEGSDSPGSSGRVPIAHSSTVEVMQLTITGMHCTSCQNTVENALNAVDGVSSVSVNVMSGEAEVAVSSNVAVDDLIDAVEATGFDAKLHSRRNLSRKSRKEERRFNFTLQVGGMSCASCARKIEGALAQIPGVP